MKKEQGNALFLILIAVALFAALSYAVTQSGGGGGTIDKEQNIIKTALLMDQVSLIKNHIQRLYILNEVDQVRFDSSAYNTAGTVYINGGGSTTGRTVGVFDATDGISELYPPIELWSTITGTSNIFVWNYISNTQVTISGSELGTSADDEILNLIVMTKDACELINKNLTGSIVIPTYSQAGGLASYAERLQRDGTIFTWNTFSVFNLGVIPGCNELITAPGRYDYFDIVKQN